MEGVSPVRRECGSPRGEALCTRASPAAAAPSATAAASQPSPEPKTAAASEKALKTPLTKQERGLIAAGYKVRVRDGERQFCKTDTALGSRLNTNTICGTADSLTQAEGDRQDPIRRIQVDGPGPRF
jgi:hypothetical protein